MRLKSRNGSLGCSPTRLRSRPSVTRVMRRARRASGRPFQRQENARPFVRRRTPMAGQMECRLTCPWLSPSRCGLFCRRRLLCWCSLLRCGGRLLCRRLLRYGGCLFCWCSSFRCCSCRLLRRRFLCRRLRFALYYTLCHDSVLLAHNRGVNHIICKRQEPFSRHPTSNVVFLRNFRWKVSKATFFGHYESSIHARWHLSDSCGLIRNHATQEDQNQHRADDDVAHHGVCHRLPEQFASDRDECLTRGRRMSMLAHSDDARWHCDLR